MVNVLSPSLALRVSVGIPLRLSASAVKPIQSLALSTTTRIYASL